MFVCQGAVFVCEGMQCLRASVVALILTLKLTLTLTALPAPPVHMCHDRRRLCRAFVTHMHGWGQGQQGGQGGLSFLNGDVIC